MLILEVGLLGQRVNEYVTLVLSAKIPLYSGHTNLHSHWYFKQVSFLFVALPTEYALTLWNFWQIYK